MKNISFGFHFVLKTKKIINGLLLYISARQLIQTMRDIYQEEDLFKLV